MKTKTFLQIFTATVLVGFIFMWGCKKTTSSTTPINPGGPNQSPPVEMVSATVTGRVIDKNKQPVSGVAISTSSASTTTDVNGQFILTNIQLDKNAGYVMAKKTGYFNGSKTFELTAGSSNYVEIELITKSQSGQFDASAGGIVTISNGGSINFSGNSITDLSTGSAYSGTVSVSAFFIDPSAANFGSIMPGELLGIAKDSSEKSLQSFGMMATELTGSSGQPLQISSGKTATITFPVPSKLISTAPAKIPLWYFDEVKGLWREQDSATLQGTNYTANVSHFSFWNCDALFPTINFHALIKDQYSNPVPAAKVVIEDPNDSVNIYRYGFTDATGSITGKIPANKNLRISVYTKCGDLAYTQNFTTTTIDQDLGTIKITFQAIPVIFSGTVTNCSGASVTNGSILIFLDGFYTAGNITNGNFSVTINRCYSTADTAKITAVDFSNNSAGNLSVNNVTNTNQQQLQISTCSQLQDEYIYYTLNGINYSFIDPADSFLMAGAGASITIYAFELADRNHGFSITLYDTTKINIPQYTYLYLENYDTAGTLTTLTLTQFGNLGIGYVAGTFTGYVRDKLNGDALVPISGSFRKKRTQ